MGKTLYDKLFDDHLVSEQEDGTCLLYIDRHLVHEVTSPQAFEGLRMNNRKVKHPEYTLAVADHNVPTTDRNKPIENEDSRIQYETIDKNCKDLEKKCEDKSFKEQMSIMKKEKENLEKNLNSDRTIDSYVKEGFKNQVNKLENKYKTIHVEGEFRKDLQKMSEELKRLDHDFNKEGVYSLNDVSKGYKNALFKQDNKIQQFIKDWENYELLNNNFFKKEVGVLNSDFKLISKDLNERINTADGLRKEEDWIKKTEQDIKEGLNKSNDTLKKLEAKKKNFLGSYGKE